MRMGHEKVQKHYWEYMRGMGRPRRKCNNNNNNNNINGLQTIEFEDIEWIHPAQGRILSRAIISMAMNYQTT
jgi:hypothetical protein